jgi:RNA polymerase sigma-70 factor (ECF subfamily)
MGSAEEELLRRIAQGDQAALERLYSDYYPRLARFVLRVTRDVELAREIINDVFMVIWRSAAQFRGESTVSTWILGITYRRALKSARRYRAAPVPPAEADPPCDEVHFRYLDLDSSLARLSREQRATVELAYYFGYSYKEIAEIMGCPENTVKTRVFHARRTLKSLLET